MIVDEVECCVAGEFVRLDNYGEIFDQRCATMLTRDKALKLSRRLAKLALQLAERPKKDGHPIIAVSLSPQRANSRVVVRVRHDAPGIPKVLLGDKDRADS